jgi:hypothetical protein
MQIADPNARRRALAHQLADACPPDLASAIAMTGSTARGMADDSSDLEMNFWGAATIPTLDARIGWLAACGARAIRDAGTHADGSTWLEAEIEGIPCEIGWQTFAALDSAADALLAGTWDDLALGDLIVRAVPVRESAWLTTLQARVNVYSEATRAAQLEIARPMLTEWDESQTARLVERGARLALIADALPRLEGAIRAIFAVNRRWLPSRKWRLYDARALHHLPPDFMPRLEGVFVGTERQLADQTAALTRDTWRWVESRS